MKLNSEKPELHNGWLIAAQNTKHGNSPMIQISRIDGFTYYEDDGIEDHRWCIKFSETLMWYYSSQKKMEEDYYEIALLITNSKDDEKVYI